MKRSEAIEKLIDIVYLHSYSDLILDKEEADLILKDIENKLGMLPPMLPIPEFTFQAEHEWESENEKT